MGWDVIITLACMSSPRRLSKETAHQGRGRRRGKRDGRGRRGGKERPNEARPRVSLSPSSEDGVGTHPLCGDPSCGMFHAERHTGSRPFHLRRCLRHREGEEKQWCTGFRPRGSTYSSALNFWFPKTFLCDDRGSDPRRGRLLCRKQKYSENRQVTSEHCPGVGKTGVYAERV